MRREYVPFRETYRFDEDIVVVDVYETVDERKSSIDDIILNSFWQYKD